MAVKYALLAELEAKPGKGEALGEFLEALAASPDIRPVELIAVK